MPRRLTDEERMMMAMQQAMSNPFAAPITLESQVNDQLEQLDMSKLPSAAQTDAWGKRDTARRAASSVGPQTERLKQQQAYVNMLRSSKLPGIERVGPSNIAVRNPWDAAETAFNRAYGGYLSGKLGEDYENLSQAESNKAEAEAEYQDILKQEERGFEAEQNALNRAIQEQANERQIRALEEQIGRHRSDVARQTAWREEDAEKAAETAMQNRVSKYSKELVSSGLPRLETNIKTLTDLLAQIPEGKGIPGIGGLQNVTAGNIGTMFTVIVDAAAAAEDYLSGEKADTPTGRAIRMAWQKLLNSEMRNEIGSQQTVQEALRSRIAAGGDIWSGDADMKRGFEEIKSMAGELRNAIDAGYDPAVRERFYENNPHFWGPDTGGDGSKSLSDYTEEQLSEMSTEQLQALIDEDDKRRGNR